ncbi:putative dual specificity protein phosphatase DSP8 [Glycine max]|nr:putative dual specificity protein phosphatase DSP8 [Glycine max]
MIYEHLTTLSPQTSCFSLFPIDLVSPKFESSFVSKSALSLARAMKIEELDDGECSRDHEEKFERQIVSVDAKRALVGAGARILFYPTLLYNVLRNKIEAEFRWWDQIDEFLLLGAVPFPKDVPHLKKLGVGGVITLNEPYETLVPSSLYRAHGIDHLVIPTRDYLFAPSFVDINRAVQFIHQNATCGKTTYVHCKAGRGRSTTIVLCYLVEYKHMTPATALEYVRSRRPRVLLAPSQWKAVQNYNKRRPSPLPYSPSGDAVLITKADLEGYHSTGDAGMELAIVPKMLKTKPMIARLSCLFASLKVSGSSVPMTRRLPVSESRAC